jgi:hypothetical protein
MDSLGEGRSASKEDVNSDEEPNQGSWSVIGFQKDTVLYGTVKESLLLFRHITAAAVTESSEK